MTTKTDITLPELPVGFFKHHIAGFDGPVYAEMQMEAYARAAVEADRQSQPAISDMQLQCILQVYDDALDKAREGREFDNPGRPGSLEARAWDAGTRRGKELGPISQPATSPEGSPADAIGFESFDPDDRFFHAADKSWWRRGDDGMLVRADAPQPAASEEPNAEARRALEIASDLRKDFRDDTHNYDTMLGAATLLESFAATAAPVAQEPVAYLDVGADGYLDLGSDKSDDELSALPKGRHMLGIIGTYGADGYVAASAAQVKPDIVELARDGMEVHARIPNSPEYRVCAELVRVAEAAAPVAQEPVAWFTDDHLTDKSATTWDMTVAKRWRAKGWPVAPLYAAPVAAQPSVQNNHTQRFMADVAAELDRARAKFPGDRIMTIALAEEFGELAKAMLDEPGANVWKEAVQTAVMAARVAIDGDSSVDEWRTVKGLDNHRNEGHS